jgi:AcrR family transcriptional regulator
MPISDCEVRDPRMRRTRNLLQGALAKLLLQKSFDDISVQDITDLATVNRATFYDHYTDKFALLEAMVGGGFHQFLAQRQVRYQAGCPGALAAIILATCDYLAEVHSAGACERQTAFEPLMDAAIVKIIRRLLLAGAERKEPSARPNELVAAAASSSICAGVKYWLARPDRPPAETLVADLQALVLPMLDAGSPSQVPEHSREPLSETAR